MDSFVYGRLHEEVFKYTLDAFSNNIFDYMALLAISSGHKQP